MQAQLNQKRDDFGVCSVRYIAITIGIASPPVLWISFRGVHSGEVLMSTCMAESMILKLKKTCKMQTPLSSIKA